MDSSISAFVTISQIYLSGISSEADLTKFAQGELELPTDYKTPVPEFLPKAQRRRLSSFNKLALSCLSNVAADAQTCPLVFASRHGDLCKTVELIKDVAKNDELSPTQFALSVHNATSGIFSTALKNNAPTTTISAGGLTFSQGLLEAMMQAKQGGQPVIFCYCDMPPPHEYGAFINDTLPVCVVLLVKPEPYNSDLSLNVTNTEAPERCDNEAITFIHQLYQSEKAFSINSGALLLTFQKENGR